MNDRKTIWQLYSDRKLYSDKKDEYDRMQTEYFNEIFINEKVKKILYSRMELSTTVVLFGWAPNKDDSYFLFHHYNPNIDVLKSCDSYLAFLEKDPFYIYDKTTGGAGEVIIIEIGKYIFQLLLKYASEKAFKYLLDKLISTDSLSKATDILNQSQKKDANILVTLANKDEISKLVIANFPNSIKGLSRENINKIFSKVKLEDKFKYYYDEKGLKKYHDAESGGSIIDEEY